MPLSISDLKKKLQDHLTDGLVTVVGSGLSAAEGLPTMGELARHLDSEVPKTLPTDDQWKRIAGFLLSGESLEVALSHEEIDADSELLKTLVNVTSAFVQEREQRVLTEVIVGTRKLRFGALLPHLSVDQTKPLHIVTPNYDRLIEFAAEIEGWGVDSMFVGQSCGTLNVNEARLSFAYKIVNSKSARLLYRKRIAIAKPHGSLDWYSLNGVPIRTQIPFGSPLIVTPGTSKYRKGYDMPFDLHRTRANEAIDKASRFLILGYGFNDDHLETHLKQKLRSGTPCLILTQTLTPNALSIISECDNITAISKDGTTGFIVTTKLGSDSYPGSDLSDVFNFVKEVL